MNSALRQTKEERLPTKREFIFWYGGVQFGGIMALINIGYDLMRHSERFTPLWPPTSRVYFSWLLTLTSSPIFGFIFGCLFGLSLWAIARKLKRGGSSD